jgi:hypothetical protein
MQTFRQGMRRASAAISSHFRFGGTEIARAR